LVPGASIPTSDCAVGTLLVLQSAAVSKLPLMPCFQWMVTDAHSFCGPVFVALGQPTVSFDRPTVRGAAAICGVVRDGARGPLSQQRQGAREQRGGVRRAAGDVQIDRHDRLYAAHDRKAAGENSAALLH